MDTLPVTLIVKAPNHGDYQDHTVKCELSWTIKRLKGHLSEVYPCKPEEQKLIYSGQLLQDGVVLKDVLRQYDGQETHTVHLVYTPKQQQQQATRKMTTDKDTTDASGASSSRGSGASNTADPITSSDGLRRRNVGNSQPQAHVQSAATPPPSTFAGQLPINLQALYSQPFATVTSPPTTTAATVTNEHLAAYQHWYQQQYVNYVNQYMAYMATVQAGGGQMPAMQQQQQWPGMMMMMPNGGSSSFLPTHAGDVNAQVAGGGGAAAAAAVPPVNPVDDQGGVAGQQPRFPLLVHEPERQERDWLDHVNTMCRVGFLLLMIYFYSSALRFAIVMCAIFAIFFYRNRRALVGAGGVQQQPVMGQPQPAAPVVNPGGENQNAGEGEEAAAVPLLQPNRADNNNNHVDVANRNAAALTNGQNGQNNTPTTVLSFVRTLVTSFFYSLLPEPAMAP